MHHQIERKAPREHYVPRNLIKVEHGRYGEARAYGKSPEAARGSVTLPEAWSIVCPNRITERRREAGMEHVTQLQRAIGSISYQRLIKMETGRVIIRDSEYELVADALGVHEDDLKLPLLTHEETIQWTGRWGAGTQIEEGGDEDSVVLAAYVRHLVERTGISRTALCTQFSVSAHALVHIWHAEKPIDRWPDSTMMTVMRLADAATWDDVILTSRALRADGVLDRLIADVVKPRLRYAPEDPDRKAPWTYATDSFRTRKARRLVRTPLSATPPKENAQERKLRLQREARQARVDELETIRRAYRMALEEAREGDQRRLLETQFPTATAKQLDEVLADPGMAGFVIGRVALIRAATTNPLQDIAGALLGISRVRIQQIRQADDGKLSSFLPRTAAGFKGWLQ
jgi:hypothetical protein